MVSVKWWEQDARYVAAKVRHRLALGWHRIWIPSVGLVPELISLTSLRSSPAAKFLLKERGSNCLAKYDYSYRGGALCGPYSRLPPYSSLKRSPTLRRSGALKEGRMEHSSARRQVQKPRATTCLRSTRRSQQVRACKSSRGWNNQARRHRPHRLTRQATQTAIFGADLKRAIKEASVRVEPAQTRSAMNLGGCDAVMGAENSRGCVRGGTCRNRSGWF